jgi:MFS family permease
MAGSIAAPLLAGFAMTMIGIVIGYSSHVRWPGLAMLLLAIAAILMILAVQAAFSARSWYVDPAELDMWWPQEEDRPDLHTLKQWQADHFKLHRRWAAGFQITYNVGLVFLLMGLACCLAPPFADVGKDRWIAASVTTAFAVIEIAWIAGYWWRALSRPPLDSRPCRSTARGSGVDVDAPQEDQAA